LPVLDDVIEGELLLAEVFGDLDDALLVDIAFLAHEQAKRLFREHRRAAGQITVACDHVIH
jgi:hypothetical protein